MKLEFDFSELIDFGDALVDTFDDAMTKAAQTVARALYNRLKAKTPRKTGKLLKGWDNSTTMAFRVRKFKYGYRVELTNDVEYASAVNYGHVSMNQFGGPYEVKNRTIKTIYSDAKGAPYDGTGDLKTFVYGHFFVEKAILEMEESTAVKQLMLRCLKAWYEGCVR